MLSKLHLNDTAKRALHTLWESFIAAFALQWIVLEPLISQVRSIDSAKKFLAAVVIAVGAAVLSAVKSTLVNMTGLDVSDGTGPGSTVPLPVVAPAPVAPPAPAPADPAPPAADPPPVASAPTA